MKTATAAWLSAVAMTLTSLTVAALTQDHGDVGVIAPAQRLDLRRPTVPLDVDLSKFVLRGTLEVEGRLGHAVVQAERATDTYLAFSMSSAAEAESASHPPLNLAIVVDRSGSMQGKRLANAVEAARGMVKRLRDGDVVSLITYNTVAATLIEPTVVDADNRDRLVARIDGIAAQGDTCISCAIEAGLEVLRGRDDMVSRILLLSDGQATAGVRDVAGFERLAERARDGGCSISSVGVDADYNEVIMTAVASASNGRHYFVSEPGGLPTIFDRELDSLHALVASGTELVIDLAPGVELLEVYDRSFERRGHALVVPLGTFTEVETKTLLVKVRLSEALEGKLPVAEVHLSYDDLVEGQIVAAAASLVASSSDDPARWTEIDPLVGARVERAQTTAALWEANRLFQKGSVEQARAAVDARRLALADSRAALATRAAPAKRAAVEADVDRQLAVLDGATAGFVAPPRTAAQGKGGALPAAPARKGRVQVRQNASEAFDLAY